MSHSIGFVCIDVKTIIIWPLKLHPDYNTIQRFTKIPNITTDNCQNLNRSIAPIFLISCDPVRSNVKADLM